MARSRGGEVYARRKATYQAVESGDLMLVRGLLKLKGGARHPECLRSTGDLYCLGISGQHSIIS
jgi:hypothetical protein